jgi:hypothetical protein
MPRLQASVEPRQQEDSLIRQCILSLVLSQLLPKSITLEPWLRLATSETEATLGCYLGRAPQRSTILEARWFTRMKFLNKPKFSTKIVSIVWDRAVSGARPIGSRRRLRWIWCQDAGGKSISSLYMYHRIQCAMQFLVTIYHQA